MRPVVQTGDLMDFVELLTDAWFYTRDGVIEDMARWSKLILAVILLGIPFNGYLVRIYRGTTPAPEADDWWRLFTDGIRVIAIALVYILPLVLILLFLLFALVIASPGGSIDKETLLTGFLDSVFTLIFYFLEFIVAVLIPVAYIRFARTGQFFEAFNFGAMSETISKIGWVRYIIAVVFISLVIGIPLCIVLFALLIVLLAAALFFTKTILVVIALLAVMVALVVIVIPVIGVFQARYLTRIYEMSGE